jgi:hypothetical protein
MGNGSTILIEFNELSPELMDKWMAQGRLPNFKRFWNESQVHITDCGEQPPFLEPWIQWITVHSGLSYREHKIFNLGDGHNLQQKCLWDLLSQAGEKVWVCGSMNIRYDKPINGFILPDPWTTQIEPYPQELLPYFKFVQKNVVEYTNEKLELTAADYGRFVAFMASHGLSMATAVAIGWQLLAERLGLKKRWRRAVILDKLQFDVFRWYYKKHKPRLSTFFLNSTAHFQHFYWRNMEPDLFAVKALIEDQSEYQNAILFGYQEMDRLLGKFMDIAQSDLTLVMCTALSQQPCLKYEEMGGKTLYRPHNFDRLIEFAGVSQPFTVSPVMAEEFFIHMESEENAKVAATQLETLRIGDQRIMKVRREGVSLYCGCSMFEAIPRNTVVAAAGKVANFYDLFYQVEGMKSGMHHPDGLLWIRTPQRTHNVHPGKLPLTAVAGKISQLLGLDLGLTTSAR